LAVTAFVCQGVDPAFAHTYMCLRGMPGNSG
jgi:hypothetical protein